MRVLLVTSRFPFPSWRGNQVRSAEWLDALDDDERMLVAPEAEEPAGVGRLGQLGISAELYGLPLGGRLRAVGACALGGRPLQEGLYATTPARRALRKALEQGSWDVAIVQMIRCGWALDEIRAVRPELPVVFDAIDAMGLHYSRGVSAFPAPLRPLIRMEARRCARREQQMAAMAEVVTAVSRRDLEAIGSGRGAGRMVPVAGRETGAGGDPAPVPTVLLSGNLGYRPTVTGALWFADEVWPRLQARLSPLRWVLAGARPARAVRRLARLEGVEVHADVPDLAPFMASATAAIAPMATGSGVPMKVLEAWAAGVPVVAHPWAADGLHSEPEPGVIAAADPEEWVRALGSLLEDPESRVDLVARGRRIWQQHYSPDRVRESIRDAVAAAVNP